MASSYSTRFRLNFQAPGDNLNVWGTTLNTGVFQLLEDAMAKRVAFALSGAKTLTSANGVSDEARCAFLDVTGGTGGTITAPPAEKPYLVRNGCSGNVIVTTGAGRTATFQPGEMGWCFGDGTNFDRTVRQVFGAGPFTMAGALDMGANKITSVTNPTNPQDVATKAYADALAFAANAGILPGQIGSAGKFLTTDGATASWAAAGLTGQRTLTSTSAVVASDKEKLLKATIAVALTFPSAASLGSAFGTYVQNAGTANATVTAGSGTVDGLASYIMYPGEVRMFTNDGTNWQSVILNPFYKVWTASDAGFIWPPGYQVFEGLAWGAGGGGNAVSAAAGYGGGGGACVPFSIPAATVTAGATAAVTIGAGGAGSLGGANTAGGAGGTTTVAALISALGGRSNTGAGSDGGSPVSTASLVDYGAGASSAGVAGGGALYGGGGGGGGAGVTGGIGGPTLFGGAGGAAGGSTTGGVGGISKYGGNGGAGGVSSTTNGVNGSAPGGGGGGAGTTAATTGGNGARGEVRMWGIV